MGIWKAPSTKPTLGPNTHIRTGKKINLLVFISLSSNSNFPNQAMITIKERLVLNQVHGDMLDKGYQMNSNGIFLIIITMGLENCSLYILLEWPKPRKKGKINRNRDEFGPL